MYNLCKYLPQDSFFVITAGNEYGQHYGGEFYDYDEAFSLPCQTFRIPERKNQLTDRINFLIFATLKGLELWTKKEFSSVLAVYPSEANLFVGYILSKLSRKPLVIYMHDLFSEQKEGSRFARFYKWMETKIFSSSSAILVTNSAFCDYYFRRGVRNTLVVNSCVDLNPKNTVASTPFNEPLKKKLRIVFTGSIGGTNEDAVKCFLSTIKELRGVESVFCSPSKRDYLKTVGVGFLPKEKCFNLQRSSDVLFLPLSFTFSCEEEILCAFPTKLLEYVAAAKPILAVVPKGSFVEKFVNRYKVGIVVNELSEEKIALAIEELKDEKKRAFFSKNASVTSLLFDAKRQSKLLYSIIEKIVRRQLNY